MTNRGAATVGGDAGNVLRLPGNFLVQLNEVAEEQHDYQEKLEGASSPMEAFRYVYLINNKSIEKYVLQSRIQSQDAFKLSKNVALAGFVVLVAGIGIGIASQFTDNALSTAYLASIGGVLTEFIAGVFFWMYNRTLQQINVFYQGMMSQQHDALTALGGAPKASSEDPKEVNFWGGR
jgi:hypothetical protein